MKKTLVLLCAPVLLMVACNTSSKNEVTGSDSTAPVSSTTSNSTESKEERNKQVIMESMHALLKGDADKTLKNATPDFVDYGDGSMPALKGIDTLKAGLKAWLSNLKDYKAENLEAVADGNRVMVYGDWSGTFKGDFMAMKTAGKSFKIRDVDIFTFNDSGKITDHKSVQSMAGMMASTKQGSK